MCSFKNSLLNFNLSEFLNQNSIVMNRLNILLITLTLQFFGLQSYAKTFYIDNGNINQLINAIKQANASGGDDVIFLYPNGTYEFTKQHSVADLFDNGAGHGGVAVPTIIKQSEGGSLTIDGRGATFIRKSGSGKYRFIAAAFGSDISLLNITFRNGYSTRDGGAVRVAARSKIEIIGCKFINNRADIKGGGFDFGGHCDVNLRNNLFQDNVSYYNGNDGGGGVYGVVSDVFMDNCQFINNEAVASGGGAVFDGAETETNGGKIEIEDCLFQDNRSDAGSVGVFGGGLYLFFYGRNTGTVKRCIFRRNVCVSNKGRGLGGGMAYGSGGRVVNPDGQVENIGNNTFVEIRECLFEENQAAFLGGGLQIAQGTGRIINCTFYKNKAIDPSDQNGGLGGGLFADDGANFLIKHCTIANNKAGRFGGGVGSNSDAAFDIYNSIIAFNEVPGITDEDIKNNCQRKYIGDNNLEYPNKTRDNNDNYCNGGTRIVKDPRLGQLGNYGGTIPVIPLLSNSPAIDAATSSNTTGVDQRGLKRPNNGNNRDIGAYEYGVGGGTDDPLPAPAPTPDPDPVTGNFKFELIDGPQNKAVREINDGDEINIKNLNIDKFSVLISDYPSGTESIKFQISGGQSETTTDSGSPYALYGNNGSKFPGKNANLGNYTLTVKAYSGNNAGGSLIGQETITFKFVNQGSSPSPTPSGDFAFELINGPLNKAVIGLNDGDEINIKSLDIDKFSVLVSEYPSGTESIKFSITGGQKDNTTDSDVPYALYGNNGSKFPGKDANLGNYTLNVKAYSGNSGSGTLLGQKTISFKLVNQGSNPNPSPSPSPTPSGDFTFELINGKLNKAVRSLNDGDEINPNSLGLTHYSVLVSGYPSGTQSINFKLVAPESASSTRSSTPYALFGTNGDKFPGDDVDLGTYTLTVKAYSADGAKGNLLGQETITFKFTNGSTTPAPSPSPSPNPGNGMDFVLINAPLNKTVTSIPNGAKINPNVFGMTKYSFLVENTPNGTQSVVFTLTGADKHNSTQNSAPYTLYGGAGSKFYGDDVTFGNYTLTAKAYSKDNGGGNLLEEAKISFQFVSSGGNVSSSLVAGGPSISTPSTSSDTSPNEEATAYAFNIFPNPVIGNSLSITFPEPVQGKLQVTFNDGAGNAVLQASPSLDSQATKATLDLSNQPIVNGTYYLTIQVEGQKSITKTIVIQR